MLGCHHQVTRLRGHLEQIKHDDRMIKAEGLDSLSEEELRQVRLALSKQHAPSVCVACSGTSASACREVGCATAAHVRKPVARQVCRARGMRAPFGEGAVAFMRKQLKEWLDLSLNRCVLPAPVYMCLLTHILGIGQAACLSGVPHTLSVPSQPVHIGS